ncbi:hypothetical protein EI555_018498 [Monodon monoceros]|uniref:Uncharacterized protein n=1 Tax=Monodon monoceros TaxID=40151 RepID=A0A4V5PBS6_MONMO|nr:hypothetical protein EI555_018498 [Monodon monoceros]
MSFLDAWTSAARGRPRSPVSLKCW